MWTSAVTRRALLAAALAAAPSSRRPASAASPPIALGTVALQSGTLAQGSDQAGAALYVTAKPASTNTGVFAQAGKVPPLAAARIPTPLDFPYQFSLTTDDLTPEFASVQKEVWEKEDLILTARFDCDGVAATRGPDDLVGRSTLSKRGAADPSSWASAVVELQGRGVAGRLLTGGK